MRHLRGILSDWLLYLALRVAPDDEDGRRTAVAIGQIFVDKRRDIEKRRRMN